MGGDKGGQPIYKPKSAGLLEAVLTGSALGQLQGANPEVAKLFGSPGVSSQLSKMGITPDMISGFATPKAKVDYTGLLKQAGNLPTTAIQPGTFTPGPAYKFDVTGIPEEVYKGQRQQTFEDIARQQSQANQQANRAYSRMGFGKVAPGGVSADIGRQAMEQQARATRDIAERQGQMQSELSRWQQQQQAGENLSRENLGLQAQGQQFSQGLQSQQQQFENLMKQIGLSGSLQQQQIAGESAPLDNLMRLYQTNVGIPVGPGGGKGDPFSAILGAAGRIAPMFCLPKGTMIETSEGEIPVEDIKVDDLVKGGKVIATASYKRAPSHNFYLFKFVNGKSVVMSNGHPYFEKLAEPDLLIVHHDSLCTYDIQTEGGYYFVNGVKLGSTIRRNYGE